MLIDNVFLENMMVETERKIGLWKKQFPTLDFDVWGRVKLIGLSGITEENCYEMKNASEGFVCAFNSYMNEKGYLIRDYTNNYVPSFYSCDINLFDYVENYYHFQKQDGKLVRVKASKVLSAVHDIWVKKNPNYAEIVKEIKQLRKDGETYETSPCLRNLLQEKEMLENGNLNVVYQKIMNQNNGSTSGIFLSVNPLDLLTSSGCYDENPTNFSSCWSTDMGYGYDDYLYVDRGGCYSTPEDIIALGNIGNRGILYIPNNREVDVPNTDFSFIGYRERIHCWFDTAPHGVWLEKVYPSHSNNALERYKEALDTKGINTIDIDFEDEWDIREFTFNDQDKLYEFGGFCRSLFLDKVCIEDGLLYYLPRFRTNYSYGDNIYGLLSEDYHECADCGCSCDDSYYVEGNGYVCEDCYENNYVRCDECGNIEYVDYIYRAYDRYGDEVYVCESCLNYNYAQCDECGEYVHQDLMTSVDYLDICDECLETCYTQCDECGEYVKRDEIEEIDGRCLCNTCIFDNYVPCNECREYVKRDEIEEVDGTYICESCNSRNEVPYIISYLRGA